MENSHDLCTIEEDGDGEKVAVTSTSYPAGDSDFRLFSRQGSVHDCFGGGPGQQRLNLYALSSKLFEFITFGFVFDLFNLF